MLDEKFMLDVKNDKYTKKIILHFMNRKTYKEIQKITKLNNEKLRYILDYIKNKYEVKEKAKIYYKALKNDDISKNEIPQKNF